MLNYQVYQVKPTNIKNTSTIILLQWCHHLHVIYILFLSHTFLHLQKTSAWESEVQSIQNDEEMMPNGILFNEQTKILLAEKFINTQFLVLFTKYNLRILDDNTILSKKLNSYWTQPSLFCDLDFSAGFNSNDSFFNVDWLLKQETNKAKLEVEKLHAETNF